jgi:hypothetical protein
MPAMLDVVAVVGPGDPCQRARISYSLVLELNYPRFQYKTKQMSRLSAGVLLSRRVGW